MSIPVHLEGNVHTYVCTAHTSVPRAYSCIHQVQEICTYLRISVDVEVALTPTHGVCGYTTDGMSTTTSASHDSSVYSTCHTTLTHTVYAQLH